MPEEDKDQRCIQVRELSYLTVQFIPLIPSRCPIRVPPHAFSKTPTNSNLTSNSPFGTKMISQAAKPWSSSNSSHNPTVVDQRQLAAAELREQPPVRVPVPGEHHHARRGQPPGGVQLAHRAPEELRHAQPQRAPQGHLRPQVRQAEEDRRRRHRRLRRVALAGELQFEGWKVGNNTNP